MGTGSGGTNMTRVGRAALALLLALPAAGQELKGRWFEDADEALAAAAAAKAPVLAVALDHG